MRRTLVALLHALPFLFVAPAFVALVASVETDAHGQPPPELPPPVTCFEAIPGVGTFVDTDCDGCADFHDPAPANPAIDCTTPPPDSDGDGCIDSEDPDDDDPEIGCCFIGEARDSDCDGIPDSEEWDNDGDGCPDEDEPPGRENDPNVGCNHCYEDFDCDGIPDATDPDDDNDGCPDISDPDPEDDEQDCPDVPQHCIGDFDCDGIPDGEDPDDDNDGDPDDEDDDPFCNNAIDEDCDGCNDEFDPHPNDPRFGCEIDGDPCPYNDADCDGEDDDEDPCINQDDSDCDGCQNEADPEPLNPSVGCPPEDCDNPSGLDRDCDGCNDSVDEFPDVPNGEGIDCGDPEECDEETDADCDGCPDDQDEDPQDPLVGCPDDEHCCECCCSQCQTPTEIEPGEDAEAFNPQFELAFQDAGIDPLVATATSSIPTQLDERDNQLGLDFSVDYDGRAFFDGTSTWVWIPSVSAGWDPETVELLDFWRPIIRMIIALVIWVEFAQHLIKSFARW